nr:hypothetical protein [uncultured Ottowia sp.]
MTSKNNELQQIDAQEYIRGPWLCVEISADGQQAGYAIINNECSLRVGECFAVVASLARNNAAKAVLIGAAPKLLDALDEILRCDEAATQAAIESLKREEGDWTPEQDALDEAILNAGKLVSSLKAEIRRAAGC